MTNPLPPTPMPLPITQATADTLWADPLRHGGTYFPPVGLQTTGTLEFDGVVFTVIRNQEIPPEHRKRLRARLPVLRNWWWR